MVENTEYEFSQNTATYVEHESAKTTAEIIADRPEVEGGSLVFLRENRGASFRNLKRLIRIAFLETAEVSADLANEDADYPLRFASAMLTDCERRCLEHLGPARHPNL